MDISSADKLSRRGPDWARLAALSLGSVIVVTIVGCLLWPVDPDPMKSWEKPPQDRILLYSDGTGSARGPSQVMLGDTFRFSLHEPWIDVVSREGKIRFTARWNDSMADDEQIVHLSRHDRPFYFKDNSWPTELVADYLPASRKPR